MNSKAYEAFLRQQRYSDEEIDAVQKQIEKTKEDNLTKATILMSRSQDIKNYVNIPTQLKPEIPKEIKPRFDHSLDMKRNIGLKSITINEDGEMDCGDGLVMGNLTSKDL